MPIPKKEHRKIMRALDSFGEVTALGVGDSNAEVQQLQVRHKGRLIDKQYVDLYLLAMRTGTRYHVDASGKTHIITFTG